MRYSTPEKVRAARDAIQTTDDFRAHRLNPLPCRVCGAAHQGRKLVRVSGREHRVIKGTARCARCGA